MRSRKIFDLPFIGVDKSGQEHLLVGSDGSLSIIIRINNPIVRYAASPVTYEEFHQLINNIVKVLGDGYMLQKQDIISQNTYPQKPADEYLQGKYNAHFSGRDYLCVRTYLTITRPVRKSAFYVYDAKALINFRAAIRQSN
jgi:hypothetical protein